MDITPARVAKISDDRAAERSRRARLTSVTGGVAQVVYLATALFTVPLLTGYLGPERYGVWVTLSAVLGWLAMVDLGLGGNALVNAIAEAHGRDDTAFARELVATAFWTLQSIAAVVVVLMLVVCVFLPLPSLFNTEVAFGEIYRALAFLLTGFALSVPLNVVGAIHHGYQRGYHANAWTAFGSVLTLAAIAFATRFSGGLATTAAAVALSRVVAAGLSAAVLFVWMRPVLRPALSARGVRSFRRLLDLGLPYLGAQMAAIGMFQAQPLIITQLLGPTSTGMFNVAHRLMALPLTGVQILASPLLPAYGEARARRERHWISEAFARSIKVSLLVGGSMAVALAAFAPTIITVWVGEAMRPASNVVWWLAAYAIVGAAATPLSVLLYGIERVRGQAVVAAATAVLTIVVGVWFTSRWGLAGMAAAMTVALLVANLGGQMFEIYRARADWRAHRS